VATNHVIFGVLSISTHLVFDCLLAFLAGLALIFAKRGTTAAILVTILMLAGPLNRFHNMATDEGNRYAAQSARRVMLDTAHAELVREQTADPSAAPKLQIVDRSNRIKEHLLAHSDRAIVKYLDLAAGLDAYVPKNYPWYVMYRGEDRWISTFYGYELHVSTPSAYRELNPQLVLPGKSEWTFRPNWDYVLRAGAEFVLFNDGDPDLDPALAEHVDLSDPDRILRFADKGLVLAPLKAPERPALAFDNGYLIVEGPARVTEFDTNRANKVAVQLEAEGETRITYPFWGRNKSLHYLLDGREVKPEFVDILATVTVPAGTHHFEVRYRNSLLRLFTFTYALFVFGALACALWPRSAERRIGKPLARLRERIASLLPEPRA
jgi:hypothetical protein